MELNEFMFPTKLEMRYGVVMKNTYGSVILKNIFTVDVPSTLAASYRSVGMFIRIPDVISIVYGMPTHILMIMTITFASISLSVALSPRNPIGSDIHPIFCKSELMGPYSPRRFLTARRDMNCGTAIVRMNIVRNSFFAFRPFLFMSRAKIMPPK